MLAVAVATVDGPVATRLEGYLSLLAALRTSNRIHLPAGTSIVAAAVAATVAAVSTGRTAILASLGEIGVAFLCEEFLFLDGKGKLTPAIFAGKGFLLVTH